MLSTHLKAIPPWFYDLYADLGITTLSWFHCTWQRPARRRRQASAGHWLLVVVADGAVTIQQQNRTLQLATGEAAILPPGAPLREQTHVRTLEARLPIVIVSHHSLPRNPLNHIPHSIPLPLADCERAREQLNELKTMTQGTRTNSPEGRLVANLLLQDLLLNALAGGFSQGVLSQEPVFIPPWVQRCRELLKEHYQDPNYSVANLHAAIGHSTSEIYRRFKEAFEYPPKEWLHRYRISIAAQILANQPQIKIAHLAQRCGYRSRSLFYRMFERYQGCTPSSLRKSSPNISD